MYIQGDDTRPPCVSPYEQGTHLASLHAAFGTLSALWERQTSGCGQVVEVSAQEVLAQIYYTLVRYSHGKTSCAAPAPATRSLRTAIIAARTAISSSPSSNHISGTGW